MKTLTWANASVLPWVGRTDPVLSGIQSTIGQPSFEDSSQKFGPTLILENSSKVPMLLGTTPKVRVAPRAQLSQFLHFGMIDRCFIFDRKTLRVEHPNVTSYVV